MKSNHIPAFIRISNRITKLQYQADINHIPSPSKGNPYWCCKQCGIHDPSLSIRNGEHYKGCYVGGLSKQIEYYKQLLIELEKSNEN